MYDVNLVTTNQETACGPACLKMLLDYYGTEVDLDILIDECGVSVNGCSGKDILRVGRAHGLDMKAFNETTDSLFVQDRPAIIWWRYVHFCVFCGLDENGDPVICNPSRGRYSIDKGSFATFYSGIAFCNGDPNDLPEPIPADMLAKEDTAKGEYFIHDEILYIATEAILKGTLIRPGRNCDKVTLNEIIQEAT